MDQSEMREYMHGANNGLKNATRILVVSSRAL
nr:hypothetical protein [Tanacetum cinerariifolium]